ncbi:MAG: bifunctional DNA-binding transcriptional regulator/O6-methylguanine-DNA methyltransferase Ada, partial [Rhizobiales bacterium]|nr:bifunctional DNA-binding transcriptional regulator/O6-methylguanine-DNA methyltransferase Ada [Hyphomicrobiales bacterium]
MATAFCSSCCLSRTANPSNVRLHDSIPDAEMAGFWACKRCKPDQPSSDVQNAETVARICRLIERAEETPSLAELAESAGLSTSHFHRMFKAVTGVTPKGYAVAHRAAKVRDELGRSNTVTEAIYDAGFNSNGRFYEKSDELLGMTPTEYRAGGANAAIRFAIGECSLGSILVASSGKGVCAILIGDDPGSLVRDLQDRFPNAGLIGGDSGFEDLVAKVVGFVEAPGLGLDLPLYVRGTAFQQRVWQALRHLPAGTTASYADIAKAIGKPKAVRAVTQACAANALAVAIPCHRVIKNDGTLSGYRWGIERKRNLLEPEAKAT